MRQIFRNEMGEKMFFFFLNHRHKYAMPRQNINTSLIKCGKSFSHIYFFVFRMLKPSLNVSLIKCNVT